MFISLIAALTLNRVIGNNNIIPWFIPNDLLWFKKHTINKPVIMGSNTFYSIGRPLYNRLNIVVSRYPKKSFNNLKWVTTIDQALSSAGTAEEVVVIGGAKIYNILLNQATKLYLTHINIKMQGNIYFPYYKSNKWKSIFIEFHSNNNDKNYYNYYFEILERC